MAGNNGFIKLNRGFFDHPFWKDDRTFSLAEAWIDLIQSARFEVAPEKLIIKMKVIMIQRGELRASQRYLAKRWNWSVGKVNRFIKMLEDEKMIERRTEQSETVVKLIKYGDFNSLESKQMNTNRHANGTPTEHWQTQTKELQEGKELNNFLLEKETKEGEQFQSNENNLVNTHEESSKKVAQKKVSFKPPDPQEVQNYCDERQNGLNGQEFCDFYESKGWLIGKNKMKSWEAAVRTWEKYRKNENGRTNNSKNGFNTGKISGHQFAANKLREHFAGNSKSGDYSIDIEAVEQR